MFSACLIFRSDFPAGWKNQNRHSTLNLSFNALSKQHDPHIRMYSAYDIQIETKKTNLLSLSSVHIFTLHFLCVEPIFYMDSKSFCLHVNVVMQVSLLQLYCLPFGLWLLVINLIQPNFYCYSSAFAYMNVGMQSWRNNNGHVSLLFAL